MKLLYITASTILLSFQPIWAKSLHHEVHNKDILGISLGDSIKKVKRILKCENKDYVILKIHGEVSGGGVSCKIENEYYKIQFDYKLEIYEIERTVVFSVEPDFNRIGENLLLKYGKPKASAAAAGKAKKMAMVEMCWGYHCRSRKIDSDYWLGRSTSQYGIYFYIRIISNDKENDHKLFFHLYDEKRYLEDAKWEDNFRKKLIDKKSAEESNIKY